MTRPSKEHYISFNLEDCLWENETLMNIHPASFSFLTAVGAMHIRGHVLSIPMQRIANVGVKFFGRKWRYYYTKMVEEGFIAENGDGTITVPSVVMNSKLKHWKVQEENYWETRVGKKVVSQESLEITKKYSQKPVPAPAWANTGTVINKMGHTLSIATSKGKRFCYTCGNEIPTEDSNYHGGYDYDYVSEEWETVEH